METGDRPFELHGTLWLSVAGEKLGGGQRMALLAGIAECGSISQAARAMQMSYKAAWDAIDSMNNLAGEPLVANFRLIERAHRDFIAQLNRQAGGIADDYLLLRRMSMKTSARNQFFGRVIRVTSGAVNDEIELEIAGNQPIVAIVTRESTLELGLQPGAEAFALIKASSIILVADPAGACFSARNRLAGKIERIHRGAVNTEVVLELPGDIALAAIVTNQSSSDLGLQEGRAMTAIFKASSVIVGVPA